MRTEWDASRYDAEHGYVTRYGESLIDVLAPQSGERILDLGCGTGHLTHQIAERGAAVVGIDISTAMIEQARAAYPDLEFHVANAASFSFAESFDAVFSNAALHWIPATAQDAVAASIARALRPGGRLVAELGVRGNIGRIRLALEDALRSVAPDVPVPNPWFFPSV
ncbi:MAG: hypothetical protein QOF51_1818, partial [Chloroflexota bacterium]|nr:hypothetical protein [Chloroflexota bacterium]